MVLMSEHTSEAPEYATNQPPAFLTTREFSRRTRLSPATVRRLCSAGDLASVVVSDRGDRRIPSSEVTRLLDEAFSNRVDLDHDVSPAASEPSEPAEGPVGACSSADAGDGVSEGSKGQP